MSKIKAVFGSVIVLYFVIGLEILIMISPFAGFFYAAFNPFLLFLVQHPATRWLTAFFLPHMVSPPDLLLKSIRVSGSVLFVAGTLIFLSCAFQVYYNKFFRKGVALHGLYSYLRHPQYFGLGMTGLGLSILWPRFLVLALWNLMMVVYYFLAKDEERRMLGQYDTEYRSYMERTGMFVPRAVEYAFGKLVPSSRLLKAVLGSVLMLAVTLGGAFLLREHTVNALPLWQEEPVATLPLLPDDIFKVEHRMGAVLQLPEVASRLPKDKGPYLVYFMPKDYVMQGMIADTGGEWQLYKRHHTVAMISDWIFHPFRHLEGGHAMMHHSGEHEMGGHDMGGNAVDGGVTRRMIFLRILSSEPFSPAALFAINARRVPVFMADVDIHNLALVEIRDLPAETGWGQVPTPTF